MSLYHEAAQILTNAKQNGGSLKNLVFGNKTLKSDKPTLFALTTESAKWSDVLSEVVDRSGVLKVEKTLTPTLALLLTHDLFLSKKGIRLPATHGLNAAISRHKARLSAELTKARLRRGFRSLDALREHINFGNGQQLMPTSNGDNETRTTARHPRWIRVNTLKTTVDAELTSTFANYTQVQTLKEITYPSTQNTNERIYHIDESIPNLIAITGPDDPTTFKSYKNGTLVLQEKASCFPAYLLGLSSVDGDVIDACAAPGNKTTHLAAIISSPAPDHGAIKRKIHAFEKDPTRSQTLLKMIKLAGAEDLVHCNLSRNFLKFDPNNKVFAHVKSLLLDPSCSGSGIWGRDEASVVVRLPTVATSTEPEKKKANKKRKREHREELQSDREAEKTAIPEEEAPAEGDESEAQFQARLQRLSEFQLRIVEHAMSFPAARRITYSTCSIHAQENENVVVRALVSDIGRQRGWRVMRREEQVEGMKKWHLRGTKKGVRDALGDVGDTSAVNVDEVAEACIRCEKGGEDGTMGFFVAGFVREDVGVDSAARGTAALDQNGFGEEEDEWNGFSEEEKS